eukprot:TRINITY_DN483_c0_g2_i1.p1 TRINITY_DN483_c0_g2~~TRINITY_DN483_c0_g2_i1.p1  ORF type:complete len:422 (+),score=96.88 TRINITY_DN483_c0_g2_i1:32-1297(+)
MSSCCSNKNSNTCACSNTERTCACSKETEKEKETGTAKTQEKAKASEKEKKDSKELALSDQESVKESVRDYYAKLTTGADVEPCNCSGSVDPHLKKMLKSIPEEIITKSYGCGSPIPSGIDKLSVLDLGSGTGRDCYVVAQLVGAEGHVTGIDMTDEQLSVARKYSADFCKTMGYKQNIMEFKKGYIEDLKGAGVKGNSIDVIISNCVVNLSPDKEAVMKSAFAALKNGGEMYFSDMYRDRRVTDKVSSNSLLWGMGISGSLYVPDFVRICRACGFATPRPHTISPIPYTDPKLVNLIGNSKLFSITFRVFKLTDMDADEEDYGQVAVYKGTIPDHSHTYKLDLNNIFITNKPMLVSANTAAILTKSWLAPFFSVFGEKDTHFGPFPTPSLWSNVVKYGIDNNTSPCSSSSSSSKSKGCCA